MTLPPEIEALIARIPVTFDFPDEAVRAARAIASEMETELPSAAHMAAGTNDDPTGSGAHRRFWEGEIAGCEAELSYLGPAFDRACAMVLQVEARYLNRESAISGRREELRPSEILRRRVHLERRLARARAEVLHA